MAIQTASFLLILLGVGGFPSRSLQPGGPASSVEPTFSAAGGFEVHIDPTCTQGPKEGFKLTIVKSA